MDSVFSSKSRGITSDPIQHALSNLPMTAHVMVENSRCTQTMVTLWASFGASALPVPCACLLHPARPLDSLQFVVFSRSLPQPPSVALSPAQSLSVPLSSSVPLSPVWSQTLPPQSAQSTSSTLSPLSLFGSPQPNQSVSVAFGPFCSPALSR